MVEKKFKTYIDDFFNDLNLYDDIHNGHNYKDLLKAVIDAFLDNENSYNAYEVYETFFMIYQITSEDKSSKSNEINGPITRNERNSLLEFVKIMKKYESNTGDLIEKQRDHFIHSVNVFLLGLAIYSQNSIYRDIFKDYIEESPYQKYYRFEDDSGKVIQVSNEEFLYRWGIAALFHDIGYPVEIIGKQLKTFVNEGVKSISKTYDVHLAIDFKDFNQFNSIRKIKPEFADKYCEAYPEAKFLDLFKPTNVMAHKISSDLDVDINMLIDSLDNFVDYMGNNGFIDHGFFSSILVLNSYGSLIQNIDKKDQDFFFYPIVDSASAILLHNYYRNMLQAKPFYLDQLYPQDSPLAFLLILCDELQEWNRRPLGVKDKQRNHVNDSIIKITDEELDITYVVKSGSLGFGFSKDKVSFLNDVLFVDVLFEKFNIVTKIELEDVIKEIEKRDVNPPYIIMSNIEKLAIEVHNNYVENEKKKGKDVAIENYNDLSAEMKLSNIRQAKSIPVKLNMIGCEIALEDDEREAYHFSNDEIENLAIFEHERWCEEKRKNGWTYGKRRNEKYKKHPSLIDWEKLSKSEKQKDIDSVMNIPEILKAINLKIVTSKLKLLTIEKHKYYSMRVRGKKFEELSKDIRFSNYKQTELLVKSLGDLGYSLVSIEEPGEKVQLSAQEIEYLAEREHESWYLDNINLGWKYGPIKSKTDRTNPNLVSWKKLNKKVKKLNIRTLSNLQNLCNDVGLKRVDSE